MGKKSKRTGRNTPKRSDDEMYLAGLDLPIPLLIEATTPPRDNRQLADHCLDNLRRLGKQVEMRFVLFPKYIKLLVETLGEYGDDVEEVWYKRHFKFLRKIANDEAELMYFRVVSLFNYSFLYCRKCDMEGSIEILEKVVVLCKNASEVEKSRRLPSGELVGKVLADRQRDAEYLINDSYNQNHVAVLRSQTETVHVPFIAGNHCDNCLKTKAELEVDKLFCCSRCQLEYYCSKECQLSAWKKWHKQRCRAKGDMRPGDQVHHDEGSQVHIVQLVEYLNEQDSWVVADLCGKDQRTVPTKKLARIRPALRHCPKTYENFVENG